MDDGRFHAATAETKLQHAELCRVSVRAPANSPVALIASLLAAYNAGPGRIVGMRKEAAKSNLDPDC